MQDSFYRQLKPVEVAPYIFKFKFLTPEFCKYIINVCEKLNTWSPAEEDPEFYTQDINFEQELPTLFKTISNRLRDSIYPIIEPAMGTEIDLPYTIFAIKYCMEGQKHLPIHRDESYVSGSIKLNNDYEGAELTFPEQGFTNKDLEVGDLLMWPGSITHPHGSDHLLKGTKYSVTIWTPYPVIENREHTRKS